MAEILELLASRNKQRAQQNAGGQQMITAIVLRTDASRIVVSDGSHSFACESVLTEMPRTGDRVWVARGSGVGVILGIAGRDKDFGA